MAVPVSGVELLFPTYDTVKDAPLRAPTDADVQLSVTAHVAPGLSTPLHVLPVTDTPVPVTLDPVIVMGPGLLFWTWTVVDDG
jgi:hypothetical protein